MQLSPTHPEPSLAPPLAAAFEDVRPEQLHVRCLRKRAYMSDAVLGAQVAWFNALCADDYDLPAFREWQAAQDAADAAAEGEGEDEEEGNGVAARAAATAAAARGQEGEGQEPDDFWALQDEFYKEEEPAAAAGAKRGSGSGGEEQPAATQ